MPVTNTDLTPIPARIEDLKGDVIFDTPVVGDGLFYTGVGWDVLPDLQGRLAALEGGGGGLTIPGVASLPAAGAGLRGQMRLVQGGTGVRDLIEVCIKLDDDSYAWRPILL